ncbi:phytoene/squalene synthase family protein [Brevibacterium sp. LE-L]|uniref:phytoene/squalene synthase family protein n=1 Tax=Brevibacterium sp. LE-L TaxID=3418557 RepID=UPI003CF2C4B0
MRHGVDRMGPLGRYSSVSDRVAKSVIGAYSTSFGLATRLLGPRHRDHVRNIYALVRVADELVDGVAAEAGVDADQQRRMLDQLESETESGMRLGYSSNPIIHAYARTARAAEIGAELTRPFFASMRTDLQLTPADPKITEAADPVSFGPADHADYVYGSAEVVGLMCLRVFIRDESCTPEDERRLVRGARSLGAAFQNVNFLRDLGDDTQRLGRSYLSETGTVDDEAQEQWIDAIRDQLDAAAQTIPLLPGDARLAVLSALRLFSELTDRLAAVPAAELPRQRIRVAGPRKAALVLRTMYEVRRGSLR